MTNSFYQLKINRSESFLTVTSLLTASVDIRINYLLKIKSVTVIDKYLA